MLSAVVSLLTAGVLMGGCMADGGGESESESDGVAAEGPNVGGGEEVGEAQQALWSGQQVKIRCDSGNCWNGQDHCMYADPSDLLNGNPAVKLGKCGPTSSRTGMSCIPGRAGRARSRTGPLSPSSDLVLPRNVGSLS